MNVLSDKTPASKSGLLCPSTELPIQARPEWTEVQFGEDYRLTAHLVGEGILLVKASGYATLQDIKKALSFIDDVIAEVIPENHDYVLIEDIYNATGITLEGRNYKLKQYGAATFAKNVQT